MKTLIIIPTYKEKENVPNLVPRVLEQDKGVEILFIDDNSPDGTGEIIDGICAENPRVHVIHREGKLGLGTAYVTGFKWVLERDYGRVFEMDADFSHDPNDIPRLIAASNEYDLVIGSRFVGGIRIMNWPFKRLLLSMMAMVYVKWITGLKLEDPTSGFKCYNRRVLEGIDLDRIRSNGYSFQIETNYKSKLAGFTTIEVPIVFTERADGVSKMNKKIVFEAIWIVYKLRVYGILRCLLRRKGKP
ncbi:polyprenol monophosphomannose synthase [bacterium]|nr:polyprenol monophosphomannose synthase [bacterium]